MHTVNPQEETYRLRSIMRRLDIGIASAIDTLEKLTADDEDEENEREATLTMLARCQELLERELR